MRKTRYFRRELRDFGKRRSIDVDLAKDFGRRLEEGEGLRERYEDLCHRFRRSRDRIPWGDRREQIRFIGHLRWVLAEVCVTALEPDLVILDEFQRFKQLLDGQDATAKLARRLFTYSDETSEVRLLLLSATPYRMYTLRHESAEDDHYRDFLRTVEFLDPQLKETGDLRRLLESYRQAMYRIQSGLEPLEQIKGEIEARLRRVMSRTERVRASTEADGMLLEVPCAGLELTAEDVGDYLALQKIGREVRQPQVLDYWKSAPYLLSFMDDYKLKTEVVAGLGSPSEKVLAKLLTGGGRLFLAWEAVGSYARIDPANARLRSVLSWLHDTEAWKLLWLPPALPYYAESGPWKAARRQQLSKRLIFSTWQVVPKAVASMLSYEVEHCIFPRFDVSIRNTPEERRRRRPLLRFAYSNDRLTGMPVLGMLYPSPSLVELGDPIPVAGGEATLEDAVARARAQLEPLLARLAEPYREAAREDESWYWAAPILLDLERYGESTREWFGRRDLSSRWTGADKDDDEGSRWVGHVKEAKRLVDASGSGRPDLGRPPEDLAEVLARRSVAGPATTALRALTRASGPDRSSALAARDSAARIAWNFRTLFNLPEAMALIRGSGSRTTLHTGDRWWTTARQATSKPC